MSKKYKGTPAEKALFIEPNLNLIYVGNYLKCV